MWRTLVGQSSGTLLWDSFVARSCGTRLRALYSSVLWDTLVGHSCWRLLWSTHSCGKLLWDTLVRHSCGVPQTTYNDVTPSAVGTANHPAPERSAAFTPACFRSPHGTDSRKHTFHRGRSKPHGTATSQTYYNLATSRTAFALQSCQL